LGILIENWGRMIERTILTIGYGALEFEAYLALLRIYDIGLLIDVRTHPHSRYRPEFNQPLLERQVTAAGIDYRFMGESLGGRPEDPSAYDEAGHVDYRKRQTAVDFRDGLDQVLMAAKSGVVICLMCSEGDPSRCHRSKLIGEALWTQGIDIGHIRPDGSVISHEQLRRELLGPQRDLFGEILRSRGALKG